MDPTLSADTLDPSQAQDDIAAFVRSAPRACTPICCPAATVTPITVLPARTARTRGVAAERNAQRACERSSDWRRGARSAPPIQMPGIREHR